MLDYVNDILPKYRLPISNDIYLPFHHVGNFYRLISLISIFTDLSRYFPIFDQKFGLFDQSNSKIRLPWVSNPLKTETFGGKEPLGYTFILDILV